MAADIPLPEAVIAPPVNLKRFDLLSLQLVLHCGRHGSISAAASHCHLSVMGASERLRRVEDAVGRPLFWRHRRGLEPTHAGRIAIDMAANVLNAMSALLTELRLISAADSFQPENSGRRRRSEGHAAPAKTPEKAASCSGDRS
jgi:DNA-binding transcriptional LysR family regulator